jgi:hypothetical protein
MGAIKVQVIYNASCHNTEGPPSITEDLEEKENQVMTDAKHPS